MSPWAKLTAWPHETKPDSADVSEGNNKGISSLVHSVKTSVCLVTAEEYNHWGFYVACQTTWIKGGEIKYIQEIFIHITDYLADFKSSTCVFTYAVILHRLLPALTWEEAHRYPHRWPVWNQNIETLKQHMRLWEICLLFIALSCILSLNNSIADKETFLKLPI